MRYLNEENIKKIDINWFEIIDVLHSVVVSIKDRDIAQPIKPYLRYKDPNNRIIAMPAYIGGETSMAGIKWIASFPSNIDIGLPRAHSIVILNDPDTGIPVGIINTARLSSIRTAGVSALMIKHSMPIVSNPLRFGITGFGPVGKMHLDMLFYLFDEYIEKVSIFDIRGVNINKVPEKMRERIKIVDRWEEAFESEVFISCTVAHTRYINMPPVRGSLHLNVSLRDYKSTFLKYVKYIVVDNWDEVCRENTDVEIMHKKEGLKASDTLSLADVVINGALKRRLSEEVVMFNPMGLAVFDISLAAHYLNYAEKIGEGRFLK